MKSNTYSSHDNVTRALSISMIAVAVLLMFTLAYNVVSAATLERQLQVGMSGSDVSSLQSYLATDATIYPQGLVTGYFGFLTKSAVSNFQARYGIATVGRVGPVTLALLNQKMVNVDTMSPAINSLNLSTTNSSVTMNWNTNENASAVVYYSTSPLSMQEGSASTAVTIGGSSLLVNTYPQTSFSATLTNLSANTTYYYVIYVRDANGNENITWPSVFHTNS